MTLERRIDLVQQQTAELEVMGKEEPSALTLEVGTWDGEDEGALTSPLRIAKKSPSVLSAKEAEDEVQEVEVKERPNSTLDSANTTGTNPDSSYSNNSFSHTQRLSNASSDGEVGIGLSLLQDLLGGGGDSGSEDGDEETDRWSRSSGEVDRFKKDDVDEEGEGTLEGLQYGEDEEEGEGVLDLGFPMPPSTMSVAGSQRSSVATTSTTTTSPLRYVQSLQQSLMSPTFWLRRSARLLTGIRRIFLVRWGRSNRASKPREMHRGIRARRRRVLGRDAEVFTTMIATAGA